MYRLKFDRFGHKAGTIVYDSVGPDYGLTSIDELYTQLPHKCVTLEPDGGTPFFTVPERDLELINV